MNLLLPFSFPLLQRVCVGFNPPVSMSGKQVCVVLRDIGDAVKGRTAACSIMVVCINAGQNHEIGLNSASVAVATLLGAGALLRTSDGRPARA